MWVEIIGYKYRYQINDDGNIQKQLPSGEWIALKPSLNGGRAVVYLARKDGSREKKAVVNLMADAFMGGRNLGTWIVHKNGDRLDNNLQNLEVISAKEGGKRYAGNSKRKPVVKIDRQGEPIEFYKSATEAAKKNFVSKNFVVYRCLRKVQDEYYSLDGYTFRYDK